MTIDPGRAQCFVYTRRVGALSAIGHDLKLKLDRFEIHLDGERVHATFDPRSIRVLGAMVDAELDTSMLSASDRKKIEANIVRDVLKAQTFRAITYEGTIARRTEDHIDVAGELTLCGESKSLDLALRREGKAWRAETVLQQTRWGITPYRAFLGQLRVHDELRIVWTVDANALEPPIDA